MSDKINEIAGRIRELREIAELSIEELAPHVNVTPEHYAEYESGTADIPISFLLALGSYFNVELSALLTGGDPKLTVYTLTRAGKGQIVNRRKEYRYQSLAYNMSSKVAEPFLVTSEPVPPGTPIAENTHAGQEFDYVLGGVMRIVIDGKELLLNPGDSVYFNSGYPHAIQAVGAEPLKFLAFVMQAEEE
jgi:mannose-6-phosphate isomerase-like protein (cupin superfamily)/DNA-binding XRE family transcriptional regulator